ncbi:isoflavone-7-O-methyltransferase 9-like [Gastrolobium bilobum]|uniref:isoflavone-7-O-methyltransferase 9-like n=1 Tax=Gastrolobium bilobum TaxID=150636 RepID=UPI002AB26398|nr:isoflavone-7-O-methyltransferase 9-like [Gastrolobium bilobum]
MASMKDFKASELFQAQAHLYKHMFNIISPMCIKWAVNLGIPDIIHKHGQPITLHELVSSLHVPHSKATCVQRLMRLLSLNDFFAIIKTDDTKEAYALTPSSQLLVKGTDYCLSSMVHLINHPTLVGLFHQLDKWTSGEDPTIFETASGPGAFWDFIHQNTTDMENFNEAMESDSRMVKLALNDCKSVFEGLDSLVDVGGGTGNTAKIICKAFPNLKCTVLDLPQVVADLSGNNNLSYVGGNMFESIPHADAILLKWVLHDWNDDDCIKILRNCKEAISGKGGKVIIIDTVINEKEDEHEMTELKILFDIAMMTLHNGKERDEKDWKQIFVRAGFEHYKIFPMFGFRSLVELYP